MQRILLNEDIHPLSDFRAQASRFINQVHTSKRPMLITQRGRGMAVLLDVNEYEIMQEKIELLQDICKSEEQIKNKELSSSENSRKSVLSRL